MNNPWSIQIELVEGCNRMCKFCGINGIWADTKDRRIRAMPTDLAFNIADNIQGFGMVNIAHPSLLHNC